MDTTQEALEKDRAFLNQVLEHTKIQISEKEKELIFDIVYQGFQPLQREEKTKERFVKMVESAIVFAHQIVAGDACHYGAAMGHMDLIEYAHTHGCPWNEATTREAASHGHFEVLKTLHEKGCPWNATLFLEPRYLKSLEVDKKERLKCLGYAVENECPIR